MPYLNDNWKQCRKCGSYMPSDWARCGRCGYPANGRGKHGGKGWIVVLALVFFIFLFRNQLLKLVPDQIKGQISDIFPFSPTASGTQEPDYQDPNGAKNNQDEAAGDGTATAPAKSAEPSSVTNDNSADNNADNREEQVRTLIRDALKNADESVRVPLLNSNDDSAAVFKMIEQIILEDPYIMFYDGCTYRTDGLITFKYGKPRDAILESVRDVDKKADEIISKIIKTGMSDYEKELAIHDYIVNTTQYDVANFKKDSVPPEGNEAYGPLIDGKAVCGGYAKAMKLLLDKVGVECFVVTGNSKGSLHAWNIVKISGKYYQTDSTWDDPVMDNGNQVLEHTYFNLSDKDISVDHSWAKSDYPACTSTTYNYFYVNKLVATTPDEFASIMRKAVKSKRDSVSIRLTGTSVKASDIEDLIKKTAEQLLIGSLYYTVNEDYKVVDLWF